MKMMKMEVMVRTTNVSLDLSRRNPCGRSHAGLIEKRRGSLEGEMGFFVHTCVLKKQFGIANRNRLEAFYFQYIHFVLTKTSFPFLYNFFTLFRNTNNFLSNQYILKKLKTTIFKHIERSSCKRHRPKRGVAGEVGTYQQSTKKKIFHQTRCLRWGTNCPQGLVNFLQVCMANPLKTWMSITGINTWVVGWWGILEEVGWWGIM